MAPGSWSTSPSKCTNAQTDRKGDYARHNGGTNLCFVDGHGKWMESNSFYSQADTLYRNPHL